MSLLDLISTVIGAKNNLKGINYAPQQATLAKYQNVADAYGNPSNPAYALLYGQQKANNLNNLSQAISEFSRQNRKSSAMGRTPLFSPERNGEATFRQAVMGYQDADEKAQNQARGILSGQAGLLGNQMGYQNALTNLGQADQSRRLTGYANIADYLKTLGF